MRRIQLFTGRQAEMFAGGAVTGFAADADFGPTRRVDAVVRVEVLAHVGTMTFDAAAVCILEVACPEERVFGIDIFVDL